MQNPLPKKKYKTIYADPPWYESGGGKIKRGADKHYPLMSNRDIKLLPVSNIAEPDCYLFMWVTNNFLPEGLDTMRHWGFRYVTNLVWGKPSFGLGQYFRGQHEICLFGVRGKLKKKVNNESTLILKPKEKHSKKPEGFYDKIERVAYPPFIELFARQRREGWDSWGNEID